MSDETVGRTHYSSLITHHWRELLGALAVLASRLATMPRTFWESDELLFAGAVRNFDPWSSHPHPPGYPLYVGLGKLFNLFIDDPFLSLRALSIVSCVIGFLALAATFRKLLDDADLAVCAALLFYFSSAVLVHGTLPLSDSPAVMFLALMFYSLASFPNGITERAAIGFGLACSAAIGTRPQLCLVLVPIFIAVLAVMRNVRKIVAALISFGVLSLAWFAPLMDAAGGWHKLMMWETRQAAYVAQHDAAASRGASGGAALFARFVAHPWGPKWIALPIFALALLGLIALRKKRGTPFAPLTSFTIVHLMVAVAIMDPADAARYSMPHMIGFALLAAAGLGMVRDSAQLRVAPYLGIVIAAIAAFAYTAPILRAREKSASPPVAAARFIDSNYPPNSIVAYDLSMRPFAEELLGRRFATKNVEVASRTFIDAPLTPLVLLGDGGTHDPDARVFSWPDSDAYGKLTRNHYRVVTVDPITPGERYFPISGVYALERNAQGEEWRWLAQRAVIRLPRMHGPEVILTMQLSHDAPYDTNPVHILVNGVEVAKAAVGRDATKVTAPLPLKDDVVVEVTIAAEQSFSPENVLHNQDPRILSVQLVRVESLRVVNVR